MVHSRFYRSYRGRGESKGVRQVPKTFTRYVHKTSRSKAMTAEQALLAGTCSPLQKHSRTTVQSASHSRSLLFQFHIDSRSLQVPSVKLRGDWAGKISLHVQHRWDAVSFVFGNMSRSQRAQWQTLDSLTLWGIHLFSFCWRVSCWWEGGYCYLWTEQDESFLVG